MNEPIIPKILYLISAHSHSQREFVQLSRAKNSIKCSCKHNSVQKKNMIDIHLYFAGRLCTVQVIFALTQYVRHFTKRSLIAMYKGFVHMCIFIRRLCHIASPSRPLTWINGCRHGIVTIQKQWKLIAALDSSMLRFGEQLSTLIDTTFVENCWNYNKIQSFHFV